MVTSWREWFYKESNMTQLYAMIKKNSRHYSQQSYHTDENGKPTPFEIEFPATHRSGGEAIGGVGGNYFINELNFYVLINDKFVRVK